MKKNQLSDKKSTQFILLFFRRVLWVFLARSLYSILISPHTPTTEQHAEATSYGE